MVRKLMKNTHTQPFRGPIAITRIPTGKIIEKNEDSAFGPLSFIDHAMMQKGITIKMHEHINDEILSYVWSGTMYHRDSAGYEVPVNRGNLMLMNAGSSFWHEERVKEEHVEMLQIFVRPKEADLEATIQFHEKPVANRDWYMMVGPEGSEAPLFVRQQVYILDAHPLKGDTLELPKMEGFKPFLFVMDGSIMVGETEVNKLEAVTDLEQSLPKVEILEDTTLVLFLVDLNAPMTLSGTISGKQDS